ncbi:MAG: site-specific integrase [Gemmatales bacterium]
MLELYGRTLVKEFCPKSLKAVRQKMIRSKLARKVINQRICRLKHVFKWGASEELVPGDVWHQISAIAGLQKGRTAAHETEPVQPVSLEDFERVVSECRPTVAAMARLQLLSGMRPGEVCRITPGQVDRSAPIWIYRPHQHKTSWRGKVREIAIGPRGQDVLRTYLLRCKDDPCLTSAGQGNGKRTTSEKPYSPSDYGLYLRRVAKRIGLEPWAPNQLRHTRATEIRQRYGLDQARAVLGHSTPIITESRPSRIEMPYKPLCKKLASGRG